MSLKLDPISRAVAATGLDIQPFQSRFIRAVFGRKPIGIGVLSLPRGAGKTELIGRVAGLAVVPGSPLYRAGLGAVAFAGSMRQCRALFAAAKRALPPGKFRIRDNNQDISIQSTDGETKLTIFPSSGKRALGLGAGEHLFCADEPASWPVRDGTLLWAAITGSLGKLPQQKAIALGTVSPADPGSWWAELCGSKGDTRTYVQVHHAPTSARWDDLRVASRANPLLRINAELRAVVRAERDDARLKPEKEAQYRAWRLNQHVSAEDDMLLSVAEWERTLPRPLPEREGRCVLGLDIGQSRSWSAAWMAWANGRQECIAVVPGVPGLGEQARRDGLPAGRLERLIDDGVLVVDHGRRVARVETLFAALPRDLAVSHLVCDRFNLDSVRDLSRWPVVPRVNQWSTATEDIGQFRGAVLDGAFVVDPNCRRLAELSFAHARVERDTSGNTKMHKAHRRQRDDIAQAAVLAVAACSRMPVRRSVGAYSGPV